MGDLRRMKKPLSAEERKLLASYKEVK